jgi:hypothetical protein
MQRYHDDLVRITNYITNHPSNYLAALSSMLMKYSEAKSKRGRLIVLMLLERIMKTIELSNASWNSNEKLKELEHLIPNRFKGTERPVERRQVGGGKPTLKIAEGSEQCTPVPQEIVSTISITIVIK